MSNALVSHDPLISGVLKMVPWGSGGGARMTINVVGTFYDMLHRELGVYVGCSHHIQ